jgi:hypothetical protein
LRRIVGKLLVAQPQPGEPRNMGDINVDGHPDEFRGCDGTPLSALRSRLESCRRVVPPPLPG